VLNDIKVRRIRAFPKRCWDRRVRCVVPVDAEGWFIVGAKYGRGLGSCRTPKGWSAPAFFVVTGGSFGFQIGGQGGGPRDADHEQRRDEASAVERVSRWGRTLPVRQAVGRHAEGNTVGKMRAEVADLFARTRTVCGRELNGAVIKQDKDSTREFYGRMVPFRTS